jgi:two-component system, NtrC family, response regulator GlrR
MPLGKILVVDDDKNLLELLRMRLEAADYEVATSLTEEEAEEMVREEAFDLAVVDLQLQKMDGIALMRQLHLIHPDLSVIILTAHGSIETAVEAVKSGAFTYLTKPFDPRALLIDIEKALENKKLTQEIKRLKEMLSERFDIPNIIAKSEKMREVITMVSRAAETDSTVYIQGESGTGKEIIAKAIHLTSARKDQPFVALNCAAIPETLLESELFGYEKGAFTGAIRSMKGQLAQADKGTLFLDEIGDMPLSIQAKLLRVLQERQYYPLGGKKSISVDIRVLVATNKNLEEEMQKGAFREDLFYRIYVIPIIIPPLRERKEDIPALVDFFLKKLARQMNKEVKGLTPMAMQKLMIHDWPGNVRELENSLEFAVAMSPYELITEDLILRGRDVPEEPLVSLKEAREDFERRYIIRLLELTKGNVSKASGLAKRYRADFYHLLKKYHLDPDIFKKEKPARTQEGD